MKTDRTLCLSLLVVAALLSSTTALPASARAQAPEPNIGESLASQTATTTTAAASLELPQIDTLILKYKTPAEHLAHDQAPAVEYTSDGQPLAPMRKLSLDAIATLSQQAGVILTQEREMSGGAFVLALPTPVPYDEAVLISKKLMLLSEVEYAVPNGRKHILIEPNDPEYPSQWHYAAPASGKYGVNLPGAWDITTGSTNIIVAVIDTGTLFNHPDLAGRIVSGTVSGSAGYDFVTDPVTGNDNQGISNTDSRDPDPSDPGDWCDLFSSLWHGTHVAGTIGAATNNGIGVAGINWVSKILSVRVLGKCGGEDSDILDGMRWAAGLSVPGAPTNPNPARVLNLSLGGIGSCEKAFQSAIDDIVNKGAVVVVAAGNRGDRSVPNVDTPANCANVISVAATNRNGNRASYSSYGSEIEISAPGGELSGSNGVLSTLNAGMTTPTTYIYAYEAGTSMAAPHVAGIASLMLSVNPALNPGRTMQLLQSTATSFPTGSTCNTSICGDGIVNAGAAVKAAQTATSNLTKRAYLPTIRK